MRILFTIILLSPLLFGFKVGEILPQKLQNTLNLENDKITLVHFFASWCHSCEKELPMLNSLPLDSHHTIMIGIDIDTDITKAKKFQEKLQLHFPLINDTNQEIVKAFNPVAMPALYYVKEGKILKIISGAKKEILHIIEEDLKSFR